MKSQELIAGIPTDKSGMYCEAVVLRCLNDATAWHLRAIMKMRFTSRSENCLYGTRTGVAESTVAFGPNRPEVPAPQQ